MIKISACIITLNEEHSISDCLESIKWCDEIIVIDSGSKDQTVAICETAGCKVMYHKFRTFSLQRQFASMQASNDWILFIDADERLSPELKTEFEKLTEEETGNYVAYNLRFKSYIYGRLMRSCGLKNEKHIRFYNRRKVNFDDKIVHESLHISGPVGSLDGYVVHYTYPDLFEHIVKMNKYTEMWSSESAQRGAKTNLIKILIQMPIKFFQFYILKGGFIDGFQGFAFSFMHGVTGTVKYAKLYHKQKTR